MKLLDRHEFTNGKAFETYYLDADDIARHNLPECDVIGFCYDDERKGTQLVAMRPDEALIQARMLVDAVRKVSESYEVSEPREYSLTHVSSIDGERKEVTIKR